MDTNQPNPPVEPQQPVGPPTPEYPPASTPTPTPAPVTPQPAGPIGSRAFSASSPQPQPKKPKKGIIIGGIIAGALVLFGGTGALAYNLWYQNPEKVIFDALTHAFKAESSTGTGEILIKSDDVDLKVTFDGESKDGDGRVDTTIKLEGKSASDTISIDVKASLLVKGETLYFKLDNVQSTVDKIAKSYGVTVPEYFTPIIKKIDGQWVSVKASDYEDVSKETAKQQRCITDLFDGLSSNKSMKDELVALYKKNRIFVIDEKLSSKKIDGVNSLGYEISADVKATQGFIRGLADTELGKEMKKCDDSIDFAEAADSIEEADEESDTDVKFELWVSRFGHKITEVRLTADNDEASGSFVFNPKFNKDVTIEAPKDSITIKQLQEDIEKAVEEFYEDAYGGSSYDYDYEDDESSPYNLN